MTERRAQYVADRVSRETAPGQDSDGSPSPQEGFVETFDNLQNRLEWLHGSKMTWRQIAGLFPGVSAGTLCDIAKGREPKGAVIRKALGLPPLVRVQAPAGIDVQPASLIVHSSRICDCGCNRNFVPGQANQKRIRGHRRPRQRREGNNGLS